MFRREEPVEPTAQIALGRKPISILTNGVQASTFWPRSLPGVGQDALVSVGGVGRTVLFERAGLLWDFEDLGVCGEH